MNIAIFKRMGTTLKGIAAMALLLTLATLLALTFRHLGINESNIILVYILSVMLISYYTEGYLFSLVASLAGVMVFNYFFTEPFYSFEFYHSDYAFTFVFMFLSALLTSTLTYRIRSAVKISQQRESRTSLLYHIGQRLIRAENVAEIVRIVGEECSHILGVETVIATQGLSNYHYFVNGKADPTRHYASYHYATMNDVYTRHAAEVVYKKFKDDRSMYYIPLIGQSVCYGVIGFELQEKEIITEEKKDLTIAIASLMIMALERIMYQAEQQKIELMAESEHLRGNLLRAISHDLRTPLAGILGATNTILDNYGQLDGKSIVELLENVHLDTQWLIHTVENILSLTRLDEGRITLNLQGEYVDEIFAEVLRLTAKNTQDHDIQVALEDNTMQVTMDGQLMKQVLLNLIDNATKYTPQGGTITLSASLDKTGTQALIRVSDTGKGIEPHALESIFNRFYTSSDGKDQGRRGIGLGLEICKAIVEAHGGKILAHNGAEQGAVFEITLPVA